MSTSYYLYGAQDINGKLVCINPVFRDNESNEIVATTHKSWSRSYFGETSEKLEEIGLRVNLSELPDEIKREFRINDETSYITCYAAELDSVRSCIPEGQRHEYHGIYTKDRVFAYEAGEIEDLYGDDVELENYIKLDDTYRQKYIYYEWYNPYGWFVNLKTILEHFEWQIHDWEEVHPDASDNGKYYLLLLIC